MSEVMNLPAAVPELPVSDIRAATEAYARQMGFSVDWTYEDFLAGISRDAARIFLRRRESGSASAVIWLNMASPSEVDELYAEWTERGVTIVEELQTTSYNLRHFIAQDLDGNRLRVFYDLGGAPA